MEKGRYIRPMELGEILDSSVRIYRENFRFLVLAQLPMALFYLGSDIITYYLKTSTVDLTALLIQYVFDMQLAEPWYQWVPWALFVLKLIMYSVTIAAVIKVASDSVLGEPPSVRRAYTFCIDNLGKLVTTHIVLSIVIGIAYGVPYAAFSGMLFYMFIDFNFDARIAAGAFFFLGVAAVAGSFVWTRLVTTFPAAVNEGDFNVTAMKRSWNLVKGYTVKMFLVMVLVFLIPTLFSLSPLIISLYLGIISEAFGTVLSTVFSVLGRAILIPLVESTRVMVYFQMRTRKEALDLTQKMEQLPDPPGYS